MTITNTQHDELMRNYNRIQNSNSRLLQERKAKVYATLPALNDMDEKLYNLRKELLMSFLNEEASNTIKKQIAELEKEKTNLIEEFFPRDYLKPIYNCSACKDTGYVDNKPCHCYKKAAIELLYASSNHKNINRDHTFERFNYNLYSNNIIPELGISARQHITNVTDFCKQFVANFDTKKENLFLYGNVGVGKTFLSDCIFNELINSFHSVIYLTAIELFSLIENAKFDKEENKDSAIIFDSLLECDLLIIDDLGTELVNTFSQSNFFYYINDRLLRNKSTIISTNFDLNVIRDTYSERIISRLTGEYTWFKIYGDDLRNLQS